MGARGSPQEEMKALGWHLPDEVGGYRLPRGAQFSPQKPTLDPALFDAQEKMRPEIREWVLSTLNRFWQPRYGNWWDWARVYLAGSSASYWWEGDNDFDILVGVSSPRLGRAHPELASLAQNQPELCSMFNAEFKEGLDVTEAHIPGHSVAYEVTFYANPWSYDIRNIKPYAAYDISDDIWTVHPVKLPKGFSAKSLPRSFWENVAKMGDHIKEILALPEPGRTEQASELLERLHRGRQVAYSPAGSGVFDQRQIMWLDLERQGLLQQLVLAVHPDVHPHQVPEVP